MSGPWEQYASSSEPSEGPWTQYSSPESESPTFYNKFVKPVIEIEKQPGVPKTAGDLTKQVGRQFLEGAMSPMPGSLITAPFKASSETASQAGSDIARSDIKSGVPVGASRLHGAIVSLGMDPLTWFGGGKNIPAPAPLKNTVKSVWGKIVQSLGRTSEKATETLLENRGALPKFTEQGGEQLAQKVEKVLAESVAERGKALNDAKKAVGFPIEVGEKAKALQETGNIFNFGNTERADIAKSFGKKYGGISGHMPDWLEQAATAYLKSPEEALKYLDDMIEIRTVQAGKKGLMGGEVNKLGHEGNSKSLPLPNTEMASQFKQEVMTKLRDYMSFSNPNDIKTPAELVTAIENFKAQASSLSDKTRVKLASLLQDTMNTKKFVDWTKRGDQIEGLLKSQYKDLEEVGIPESLGSAKGAMKEALDVLKGLQKKIGQGEGKAEQYLQRLFTSDQPIYKDELKKLASLEKISGVPILSDLSKHYAAKAFSPLIKPGATSNLQALLSLQSPRAFQAMTRLGFKGADALEGLKNASGFPLRAALNKFSQSQMQSLLDRMKNAKQRP